MSDARKRAWCFTSFQEDPPVFTGNTTYLVYGREECPDTGRGHWQGYAEFRNPKKISQTQTTLAIPGAHLEARGGTPSDAAGYCKKGDRDKPDEGWGAFADEPWETEFGDREKDPKPGTRSDIISFRDDIKRGASDLELVEEHPMCCAKYMKFKDFARATYCVPEALERGERAKMGIWLWGPPNTGKSTNHPFTFYEKPSNKWWDGYSGEEFVVVDDPTDLWCSHFAGYVKTWVQEKPFRGEIKGGSLMVRFKRIIVMSNSSMEDYFGVHFSDAIGSRFTEVNVNSIAETEAFYNEYKAAN